MAIKTDLTLLQSGLTVPDAYIRIDTVAGYKGAFDCTANAYVSRDAWLAGLSYVEQVVFRFKPDVSPDAEQIFAQAYAALKAQERFATAVDVFEDPSADPQAG